MEIKLKAVGKSFSQKRVLESINFSIPAGEITCLMGPSGCGKTTLLRMIAGFEKLSEGEIYLGDQKISSPNLHWEPQKRKLGFVFQDYALFPHLTVSENIEFGLTNFSKGERRHRIEKYLKLVGLWPWKDYLISKLSGGQKQRLAVARAIAPEPDVLLMDEAFSNIDSHLRFELARELTSLFRKLSLTCLFVTHSEDEAFNMADKIAILHEGKLQQWGTAYDLYHQPKNPFVANFLGDGRFLQARVLDSHTLGVGDISLKHDQDLTWSQGSEIQLLLRPDDVIHDDASPLKAKVIHKSFRGAYLLYELRLQNGDQIICYLPSYHNHDLGEWIGIHIQPDHIVGFSTSSLSSEKS